MDIKDMITKSEELGRWFDEHINELEFIEDAHSRYRLAISCFDLAQEHHKAIVILISHGLHGSAFSLLRVIFETYIRGLWLFRCASDDDLERFKKEDKLDKNFRDLVNDIERLEGSGAEVLSGLAQSRLWSAMNSYTHSGFLQLMRRNSAQTIESNYEEGEIIEALDFANIIGLLSAFAIISISGSTNLVNALQEKMKEYSK